MTMRSAAEAFRARQRIERVATKGVWDAVAVEVVRSSLKELLAADTSDSGKFVTSILHEDLGRQAAEAAWQSVTRGIHVGALVPFAGYCLVQTELNSLRPIVMSGPPPVAPKELQGASRAQWLAYLCDTHTSALSGASKAWSGIASFALATELRPEQLQAALQLSWDCDPDHAELSALSEIQGPQGAPVREFLMRQHIENSSTSTVSVDALAARRRPRVV